MALKEGRPPRYDNRCRDLSQERKNEFEERGVKPALRFKVPEKSLKVDDLVRGEVVFDTSLIGDFIIMKSTGTPSFNFAVVCDDISHI